MRRFHLGHLVISCVCSIFFTAAAVRTQSCQECNNTCEVHAYFAPGPDCENNIIDAIENASTIDIAMYSFTNQRIANTLIKAKQRGANIRIITDRTQAKNKYSLIQKMNDAGIPIRFHRGYKIEHNKFAIFDKKYVVTGSFNWTNNASTKNSENCVFLNCGAYEYNRQFKIL